MKLRNSDSNSAGISERMGLPAEAAIADAAGVAQLAHARLHISAEGGRAASRLGQWAWALYEGARDPNVIFQIYIISPFFATVMMRDPVRGQELWGDLTSWAGYITAILAPFFGAIADKGGPRKPWLALFTGLMVISFAGTWFGVPNSGALQIFVVAAMVAANNVVFEFSNAFHGAMLPAIAPYRRMGSLSGLAFALGNGSGFVLLIFFLAAFLLPEHPLFGVHQAAHEPERLAGPISAVWMLLAALPLFFFTPDRPRTGVPLGRAIRDGTRAVLKTVRDLKHYRNVAHYIGARSLFNDGMTGVLTFTGIYAAGTFHLGAFAMTVFGIILIFFATLGGFLGGWLDSKLGSKRALLISIGGTALFFTLGLTMGPDRIFWFVPYDIHARPALPFAFLGTWPQLIYLPIACGNALFIVAGYANTRTMMARIAPFEKMTEFFGLMSLSGTATTFFAPVSVALVTRWTHSQRGGMVAIAALLVLGWVWMFFVKEERAIAV
ncbi:MAG TPA: MFS transporter [Rhizomicrobium sp.]